MTKRFFAIAPHISPTPGFGGPAVVIRELINFLLDSGFDVIEGSVGPNFKYSKSKNHEFTVFAKSYLYRFGFSFRFLLWLSVNIKRSDILIINGMSSFPTIFACIMSIIYGNKTILLSHGGLEFNRSTSWNGFKKLFYSFNLRLLTIINKKGSLLVVFQTEVEKNKSFFNSDSSIVCSNYHRSFFSFEDASHRYYNDAIKILYVGRDSSEKGTDRLVELCEFLLLCERVNYQLTIVISGPVSATLMKYQSLDRFEFFTDLEPSELSNFYDESNILFFPSRVENFGNVLVEAVAHNLL